MGGLRVFGITIVIVSMILGIGVLIMNIVCEINETSNPDQNWLEIGRSVCYSFNYLSDFINNFLQ